MHPRYPRLLPALILIVLGVLFLAVNLGFIKGSIGALFATWWPLIPLVTGIGMLFRRGRRKDTA